MTEDWTYERLLKVTRQRDRLAWLAVSLAKEVGHSPEQACALVDAALGDDGSMTTPGRDRGRGDSK